MDDERERLAQTVIQFDAGLRSMTAGGAVLGGPRWAVPAEEATQLNRLVQAWQSFQAAIVELLESSALGNRAMEGEPAPPRLTIRPYSWAIPNGGV